MLQATVEMLKKSLQKIINIWPFPGLANSLYMCLLKKAQHQVNLKFGIHWDNNMSNRTYTVSSTGGDAVITLSANGSFYSLDDIIASYNGVPLTSGKLTVKCDGTVIFDVDICLLYTS